MTEPGETSVGSLRPPTTTEGTQPPEERGGEVERTAKTGPTASTRRTATVALPFVEATFRMPRQIRVPHVGMPHVRIQVSRQELGHAGHAVKTWLPDRDRLLLYTGLGGMAALGAISWPVAGAVAAGTVVATRVARKQRMREPSARIRQERASGGTDEHG
jgi:hypothetical protein